MSQLVHGLQWGGISSALYVPQAIIFYGSDDGRSILSPCFHLACLRRSVRDAASRFYGHIGARDMSPVSHRIPD